MTAREILDQGFAKSFLSRLFGEEMPEDYKKLEAKYIDALTQVVQRDDHIAELNSEKEVSKLRESILLGASDRFNALPVSILKKLYSICQKSVLSQIYESLQNCVALEEFEQDFNRLASVG